MKNWIIMGATSAIAEQIARLWAARGDGLYLVARSQSKLETLATDLTARGAAKVAWQVMDINQLDQHVAMLDQAQQALGPIDGLLVAHGTLPDQRACEQSVSLSLQEIATNGLSIIALLTEIANRFEARKQGCIAVIGSVAGDRGRQSNYVYGTAKAAVTTFLQGLRNRLAPAGVQVLTIKPGFVDTPMTAAFEKKGPLWAQPEQVARAIIKAVDGGRNQVYVPWFWWGIMMIIRHIPEFIFKRLRL
jgi:short-subunit dehydrogenase